MASQERKRLEDGPFDPSQALIDECYRKGRYENNLDYQHDPNPPLTAADAPWADTLLRKARYRKKSKRRR
jgi:hypothetical protein